MAVIEALFSVLDLTTGLIAVLVLFVVVYWIQTPKNLPPGPSGWPFLGCLPNLAWIKFRSGLEINDVFKHFKDRYGEVCSLYLGRRLVVVLNSHRAIKEAFQNPNLQDRPQSSLLDDVVIARGVAQASGDSWKQQRRFTQNTFRSFGVGKSSFEDQILTEAEALVEQISANNGEAFDIRHDLGNAVANVICSSVFGKRYNYDDACFRKLLDLLYRQFILVGSGGLNLFVPIMKYLQPSKQEMMRTNYRELYTFVSEVIEQHKVVFQPENLHDYIDVYLREIEISDKLGRDSHISEKTLVASVGNLFGGGTDTTANTLYWALLLMLKYPEIKDRLQKEIDDVVGRNRIPKYSDKSEMPYTEATLLEVSRWASVLPCGAPHAAGEETTLLGYHVPKDTIVLADLWGVHHDASVWGPDFDTFRPERFLDENGKICRKEEVLAFSVGRRFCPGENLARMELFLLFTHILHMFTLDKETEDTQLSLTGIIGGSHFPQPYKIRAVRRE